MAGLARTGLELTEKERAVLVKVAPPLVAGTVSAECCRVVPVCGSGFLALPHSGWPLSPKLSVTRVCEPEKANTRIRGHVADRNGSGAIESYSY